MILRRVLPHFREKILCFSVCEKLYPRCRAQLGKHIRRGLCRAGTHSSFPCLPSQAPLPLSSAPPSFLLSHPVSKWTCFRSAHEGWAHHEPLQCSFLIFHRLHAVVIPFLSLFHAPALIVVITAFFRTSMAMSRDFRWIQPPPSSELRTPVSMWRSQELSMHITKRSNNLVETQDFLSLEDKRNHNNQENNKHSHYNFSLLIAEEI